MYILPSLKKPSASENLVSSVSNCFTISAVVKSSITSIPKALPAFLANVELSSTLALESALIISLISLSITFNSSFLPAVIASDLVSFNSFNSFWILSLSANLSTA